MHFLTDGTGKSSRNPSTGFLSSFWFWSWETPVSSSRASEPSLSSLQLTCFPFFHLVNFVKCMFFAIRTVSFDFPRYLHINHSSIVTVIRRLYKNVRCVISPVLPPLFSGVVRWFLWGAKARLLCEGNTSFHLFQQIQGCLRGL